MDIQPHQLDVDELSALVKNSQMSSSQIDDVNQRWTLILQRIIDTKVGILSCSHCLISVAMLLCSLLCLFCCFQCSCAVSFAV